MCLGRSARAKYPHLSARLGTMEHMFASHRGHLGGLVVLGIDPGLTRCGYAVLQAQSATKISALSLGVLRTSPTCALPDRLAELHDEIAALLREFTPDAVAVEQVFFRPTCVQR